VGALGLAGAAAPIALAAGLGAAVALGGVAAWHLLLRRRRRAGE
jgi:hypothetical protein